MAQLQLTLGKLAALRTRREGEHQEVKKDNRVEEPAQKNLLNYN